MSRRRPISTRAIAVQAPANIAHGVIELPPAIVERTNDLEQLMQEDVMAWTEQIGEHSWRVRYVGVTGRVTSIGGFDSREAAEDYAMVVEGQRRRVVWVDPLRGRMTVADWSMSGSTAWTWTSAPGTTMPVGCVVTSCRGGARRG